MAKTASALQSFPLAQHLSGLPWHSRFFTEPTVDLGEQDDRLSGIYTPEPEIGAEKVGISDQFLKDAEAYDDRYDHAAPVMALLRSAFGAIGLDCESDLAVLDLGTGSGKNSLLPLIDELPGARFLATDLSPDLLAILRRRVDRDDLSTRVACICTDAMRDVFRPKSFDLALGIAILHHLIDPMVALRTVHAALRPGGSAIFYEPFEGFGLVEIAFRLILERAEREGSALPDQSAAFMRAMIEDLSARRGTDKSAERFRYMDDKWLFTRTYFEQAAEAIGFSSVRFLAQNCGPDALRTSVADLFRIGRSLGSEALPEWAWAVIDLMDASFSPEMKADLMLEGVVVFTK